MENNQDPIIDADRYLNLGNLSPGQIYRIQLSTDRMELSYRDNEIALYSARTSRGQRLEFFYNESMNHNENDDLVKMLDDSQGKRGEIILDLLTNHNQPEVVDVELA